MVTLGEILAECIDFDYLLMEGKDPSEILHYKFGGIVPEDIIDAVINIDPTKKKSYSQWALSRYREEESLFKQALKNGRLKSLFDNMRSNKDVQLKQIPSLSEALDNFVPESDLIFSKSDILEANNYDIVYDDDEWRICVPNTYEAACRLGMDTRWCTANAFGNGEYYYKDYTNKGKLFVNFDKRAEERLNGKTYPYTRYQFNFESKSFCDAHDDQLGSELNKILPTEVLKFYEDEGYDVSGFESLEKKYERYEEWRFNVGLSINNSLFFLPCWDDDLEIEDEEGEITYGIYTEEDDRDTSIDFYLDCLPSKLGEYIIEAFDESCIVKNERDDVYLIEKQYDSWDTIEFDSYIKQDGVYFYTTTESKGKSYLGIYTGEDGREETRCYESGDIFINSQCKERLDYAVFCIEIHSNDGVQLFIYDEDGEFVEVIRRDFPVDGEHYIADENNIIHGQYKSYNLDVYNSEEGEANKMQIIKKINDDVALVEMDSAFKNLYSISKQVVFGEENFKTFEGYAFGAYVCSDKKMFVLNSEGRRITSDYKRIRAVDRNCPLFIGETDEETEVLIDPNKGEIASIKKYLGLVGSNKQYCTIKLLDVEKNVLFDIAHQKIVDLGGSIIIATNTKVGLGESNNVVIVKDETNLYSAYDVDTRKLICNNIQNILPMGSRFSYGINEQLYKVKVNNGFNILDANSKQLLLQKNYLDISSIRNNSGSDRYICILSDGSTNSFFDCNSKQIVLTTNRVPSVEPREVTLTGIQFYCEDIGSYICYNFTTHKFHSYNGYAVNRTPIDGEDASTQERYKPILDALGAISTNSIRESFNRFYNKIRLD